MRAGRRFFERHARGTSLLTFAERQRLERRLSRQRLFWQVVFFVCIFTLTTWAGMDIYAVGVSDGQAAACAPK